MSKKVLVIDDSRAMRTILGGILGELGYEVKGAADGGKALEILNAGESFDLALVDWNMPKMSGYDFVCEVRKEARFADLRLVMVTTETEESRMSDALDAGADEYIMKPFNKDMLLEKLLLIGVEAEQA